jgi:Methane oxygenase PmoA
MKPLSLGRHAAFFSFLVASVVAQTACADWQRDDTSLAWRDGTNVVWRFSFDPQKGKTFFDPVAVRGTTFTNFKPEDHPWHYGLWFSWKYINKANYWEENRATGKAEGATRWLPPEIVTKPDGSAVITLILSYAHSSGRVDLMERRDLNISAPKADGSYAIDWRANFKAGKEGAVLDRTPMPGEPEGKVNGGYAGLGLRMAAPPLTFSVVCSTGLVERFASDRARPFASALACNFADSGRDVGGIAIFSDPINAGEDAPWYVVNSKEMRFACAAILAPKIRMLTAGEEMKLRYRIAVRGKAWTPEALQAATP